MRLGKRWFITRVKMKNKIDQMSIWGAGEDF